MKHYNQFVVAMMNAITSNGLTTNYIIDFCIGRPEKIHSKLMEINVHVCTSELYMCLLFRTKESFSLFTQCIFQFAYWNKGTHSCPFTSVSSFHSQCAVSLSHHERHIQFSSLVRVHIHTRLRQSHLNRLVRYLHVYLSIHFSLWTRLAYETL